MYILAHIVTTLHNVASLLLHTKGESRGEAGFASQSLALIPAELTEGNVHYGPGSD